jgi:hypothetical protein
MPAIVITSIGHEASSTTEGRQPAAPPRPPKSAEVPSLDSARAVAQRRDDESASLATAAALAFYVKRFSGITF